MAASSWAGEARETWPMAASLAGLMTGRVPPSPDIHCPPMKSPTVSAIFSADIARAVDVDGGPGGVPRKARGEKDHCIGDIDGLRDLAQGNIARRGLDPMIAQEGGVEIGAYEPRRDGKGGDVLPPEMARDGAGHGNDAALGGGVMHVIRIVAAKGRPARQIDDDATALLGEMAQGFATEMTGCHQIDLQGAMPGGRPALEGILDVGRLIDPGVVHQHVDPPTPRNRALPARRNGGIARQVAQNGMAILGPQLLRQLPAAGRARSVVQDRLTARCDHRAHDRSADAARPAGHQHNLAVELDHPCLSKTPIASLPVSDRASTAVPRPEAPADMPGCLRDDQPGPEERRHQGKEHRYRL